MAGFKNTFNKGMDKDTSKQKYSNNQYTHSENLRILTDEGLTTGALENIKGNSELINFPHISTVWEITDANTLGQSENEAALVLSDGTSFTFTIEVDTTGDETLDSFESALKTNTNFQDFTWARSSDRIVFYHDTLDITSIGSGNFSKVTPAITDPIVIGSVDLRDSMILFTVSKSLTTGPTQIWKLDYDISTPTPLGTLKLLYNNKLDMSIETPIEAVTRYENSDIKRVYWTDRTNPPRMINTEADDLLALPPSQISLSPFVDLSYPYAHKLTTGTLLSGQYQVVYRLSREGGANGPTSPISAPITITGDVVDALGPNTNYEIYGQTNSDVVTEKGIIFRFDNLDTAFDVLDPYIIRRETGGLYRAFLAPRIRLGGKTEVDYELTNLNILEEIGVEEVFDFDIDFERVKTMTIKDNSLIVGNIKEAAFDIDFDARSYRFKRGTSTTYTTFNPAFGNWGIDADDDVINPSNDVRTENEVLEENYFWRRNSTSMGGDGPNISYEFPAFNVQLNDVAAYNGTTSRPREAPFSAVPPSEETIFGPNGETYEMSNSYKNHKDGIIQSYYKGYMRDEVYRFGIVLYSKTGKPSTVKWIGDIRMPQEDVINKTSTASSNESTVGRVLGIRFHVDINDIKDQISGFKIVRAPRTQADKTVIGQGIINNIGKVDDIGGEDDTIYCNTLRARFLDTNNSAYVNNDNFLPVSGAADSNKEIFGGAVTFDCPDFKMGMAPIDESATNYFLKPIAAMQNPNIGNGAATSITGDATTTYRSWYINATDYYKTVPWHHGHLFTPGHNNHWGEVTNTLKVGEGKRVEFANPISAGKLSFLNRGFIMGAINGSLHSNTTESINLNDDILASPGTDTVILTFRNRDANKYIHGAAFQRIFTEWRTTDYVQRVGYRQIVANLCKPVDNQYGGNTFRDRKDTEYISCSGFTSVERIIGGNTTFDVYGGDCYMGIAPIKKLYSENATYTLNGTGLTTSKNYTDFSFTLQSPVAGILVPIEGVGNIEMKNGSSLNTLKTITDTEINDGWVIDPAYNLERYFQKFAAEGGTVSTSTEFDNRIYKSQPKINGEVFDSWSAFKPYNNMDVDGHNGPINKLETFNDRLFFFQDSGVGEVSINPREVITSMGGSELELGTGSGLVDYKYISDTIGSKHQFSVLKSKIGLYFFDANLRKYYRLQNGLQPLSDMKGMSSWFYNTFAGDILESDNPFFTSGISTGYDNRYNELYITLNNREVDIETETTINNIVVDDTTNNSIEGFVVPIDDKRLEKGVFYLDIAPRFSILEFNGSTWGTVSPESYQQAIIDNDNIVQLKDISYGIDSFNGNFINYVVNATDYYDIPVSRFETIYPELNPGQARLVAVIEQETLPNLKAWVDHKKTKADTFSNKLDAPYQHMTIPRESTVTSTIHLLSSSASTIVFNETIDAFTGFYSHTPPHYISDGKKIITQDPDSTELYIHDIGERGEFYGTKHPSKLTLLVNPPGDTSKVFNNVEFLSQVDIDGAQKHDDTLNSIRVYNEYQDTGVVTLIPNNNIKRRMRTWRMQVPRNGVENARIRNPYTRYDFEYTNVDDKHLVLNDVASYYIDSPM